MMKNDVGFPILNSLPQMFLDSLPPAIPKAEYQSGVFTLVQNFFHNLKVSQIAKATELEAQIAINRLNQVKSQFSAIQELLLFGDKFAEAKLTIRHAKEMRDIERKTAEENLKNIQIKNLQEQIELQISQLDLKMRLREAEDGTPET